MTKLHSFQTNWKESLVLDLPYLENFEIFLIKALELSVKEIERFMTEFICVITNIEYMKIYRMPWKIYYPFHRKKEL